MQNKKYKNINKTVNLLMKNGEKNIAQNIVNNMLNLIETNIKKKPVNVFETSLELIKPIIEIRNKKIGGTLFKIPVTLHPKKQNTIAIKWLIETAKQRSEKTMSLKLYNEISNILKKQSSLIKKKDELHKLANANRAFIHYRW